MADQQRIDKLLASALEHVANQGDPGAPTSDSGESTIDDDRFDVYRREAPDRGQGDLREAFVRILAGEVRRQGHLLRPNAENAWDARSRDSSAISHGGVGERARGECRDQRAMCLT